MNISDEAVEAAAKAMYSSDGLNAWALEDVSTHNHYRRKARAALEAAAPILLSHEREEARLAHVDAMVNRETKREELAAAWEQGRVDGYHHRPNPYKETT